MTDTMNVTRKGKEYTLEFGVDIDYEGRDRYVFYGEESDYAIVRYTLYDAAGDTVNQGAFRQDHSFVDINVLVNQAFEMKKLRTVTVGNTILA